MAQRIFDLAKVAKMRDIVHGALYRLPSGEVVTGFRGWPAVRHVDANGVSLDRGWHLGSPESDRPPAHTGPYAISSMWAVKESPYHGDKHSGVFLIARDGKSDTTGGRPVEETRNLIWAQLQSGDAVEFRIGDKVRTVRVSKNNVPPLAKGDHGEWQNSAHLKNGVWEAAYSYRSTRFGFGDVRDYEASDPAWHRFEGFSLPGGKDYALSETAPTGPAYTDRAKFTIPVSYTGDGKFRPRNEYVRTERHPALTARKGTIVLLEDRFYVSVGRSYWSQIGIAPESKDMWSSIGMPQKMPEIKLGLIYDRVEAGSVPAPAGRYAKTTPASSKQEWQHGNSGRTYTFVPGPNALAGGDLGWRPIDLDGGDGKGPAFDPVAPPMAVHDLMEHFPGDEYAPHAEYMAQGAAMWLRLEGGFWGTHGKYIDEIQKPAFGQLFYHIEKGQLATQEFRTADVAGKPSTGNPFAHMPQETAFTLTELVGKLYHYIRDNYQPRNWPLLQESLARGIPWMVHGYVRAAERYKGLDKKRLVRLFVQTAERIKEVPRDGRLRMTLDYPNYRAEVELTSAVQAA